MNLYSDFALGLLVYWLCLALIIARISVASPPVLASSATGSFTSTVSVVAVVVVSATALGFAAVRDLQGSTSSVVNADDVIRSAEPTVVNALSGKASGVRITRSNGDPGAGSTIRIRGANTIDGSIQPLIIVDGVPLDNTTSYAGGNSITGSNGGVTQGSRLNDINPSDIESVNVLKGASAASL